MPIMTTTAKIAYTPLWGPLCTPWLAPPPRCWSPAHKSCAPSSSTFVSPGTPVTSLFYTQQHTPNRNHSCNNSNTHLSKTTLKPTLTCLSRITFIPTCTQHFWITLAPTSTRTDHELSHLHQHAHNFRNHTCTNIQKSLFSYSNANTHPSYNLHPSSIFSLLTGHLNNTTKQLNQKQVSVLHLFFHRLTVV